MKLKTFRFVEADQGYERLDEHYVDLMQSMRSHVAMCFPLTCFHIFRFNTKRKTHRKLSLQLCRQFTSDFPQRKSLNEQVLKDKIIKHDESNERQIEASKTFLKAKTSTISLTIAILLY